jgi:hypothetical protein
MKATQRTWQWILIGASTLILFNNCFQSSSFRSRGSLSSGGKSQGLQDVITGNPIVAMKIVDAACKVILQAHPELTEVQCQTGLLNTTFGSTLGVPDSVLNPYRTMAEAESAGLIKGDPGYMEACITAIANLNPESSAVQSAYNKNLFNPFSAVAQMIPAVDGSCADVFIANNFPDPVEPTPLPGKMVVDFDFPAPGVHRTVNDIIGIFQDIDFGYGIWTWSLPYAADTSNFAFNFPSTMGNTGFTFSGGPKKLLSIKVFASKSSETIHIYDEQGQSHKQLIPFDGQMHLVETGFTKPSHRIYIAFPVYLGVGIDDITYEVPAQPPAISQVQGRMSGVSTATSSTLGFNSENRAGDLIVVNMSWVNAVTVQSVQDSMGNVYSAASEAGVGSGGQRQQVWYAKNIKAGANTVTVTYSGSAEGLALSINEYAGIETEDPFDQSITTVGSGVNIATAAVTTSSENALVFASFRANGLLHSTVAGSDFTMRSSEYEPAITEDRIVFNSGIYSATAQLIAPTDWVAQIVAFKGKK